MLNLKAEFYFLIILMMLFIGCDKNTPDTDTVKFLSAIANPVTGEDVSVNWCKYLAGSTREISTRTSFPYHNSTVMFGSTKNSQGSLVGLDIETGEQKWEYVNIDIPIASSGDNPVNQYHSENKAYLLDSPYNHYFIDITTGDVEKNVSEEECYGEQYGIGDNVFCKFRKVDPDGAFYFCLMENDMSKSDPFEEFICPNYDFEHVTNVNSFGYINDLDLFVSDGDTLILISFDDADQSASFELSRYWSLYNLTNKEWEVERELIFEEFPGSISRVIEYNGLFYFTSYRLICIDPISKEIQWSQPVTGDLFTINDHEVLIMKMRSNNKICAFDPQTGAELWSYPKRCRGPLHYQDDILYFIGLDDQVLYGLNVQDGSLVWALESPDDSAWLWQINGIPAQNSEKGKIFVSTKTTGYCLEAAN